MAHENVSSGTQIIDETLSLIHLAKLLHPSGQLLASFVIEALNPREAARYVRHGLSSGKSSVLITD